jgi:tetratricopeptide (TPR) repeat protein
MKALEKDRDRRYETATGLARDIEHFLQDEPVEACPPSATYRMRKFARKNRKLLAGVAAFAALLATGAAVSTWQALRATAAQKQAQAAQKGEEEQRQQAEAVVRFVQDHVFAAARPQDRPGGLGQDVTLRRALEAAVPAVDKSFTGQPLVEARLRMTLGKSFLFLGQLKTAAEQLERSRAIQLQLLGPDDAATLESTVDLATTYAELKNADEALKLREDTLARRRAVLGPDHGDTLLAMQNLASSYAGARRYDTARKLQEELLPLLRTKFGRDDERTLACMNNLALTYDGLGRHEDARKLLEETVALRQTTSGPDHLDTVLTMMNLAKAYTALKHYREAAELQEKAIVLLRKKLDPDHPLVLTSMHGLANSYGFLERYADALKFHQEALRLREAKLPTDHPDVLSSMWGVAANLFKLGRGAEAVPITDEIMRRAARMKTQPELVGVLNRRLEYFRRAKDAAGCRGTAEAWEKLQRTDPLSLYDAACFRATAAAVLRATNKSPAAARLAEADADRAMEWLRRAVAAGFKDVVLLKKDKDLDYLRGRADFRKLLADLGERSERAAR